jgi:hypothetical protein
MFCVIGVDCLGRSDFNCYEAHNFQSIKEEVDGPTSSSYVSTY